MSPFPVAARSCCGGTCESVPPDPPTWPPTPPSCPISGFEQYADTNLSDSPDWLIDDGDNWYVDEDGVLRNDSEALSEDRAVWSGSCCGSYPAYVSFDYIDGPALIIFGAVVSGVSSGSVGIWINHYPDNGNGDETWVLESSGGAAAATLFEKPTNFEIWITHLSDLGWITILSVDGTVVSIQGIKLGNPLPLSNPIAMSVINITEPAQVVFIHYPGTDYLNPAMNFAIENFEFLCGSLMPPSPLGDL